MSHSSIYAIVKIIIISFASPLLKSVESSSFSSRVSKWPNSAANISATPLVFARTCYSYIYDAEGVAAGVLLPILLFRRFGFGRVADLGVLSDLPSFLSSILVLIVGPFIVPIPASCVN